VVAFLDELSSGLASAGADALKLDFAIDHGALALVVLVMPQAGALLEAPLIAFAARASRRKLIALGLFGMAIALAACALAPNAWVFAIAFGLYGPTAGIATQLAQASLVDADPDARERRMTEWSFAGVAGDIAAPLVVGAARILGLGSRVAFLVCAALLVASAAGTLFSKAGALASGPEEDEAVPKINLRTALSDLVLVGWVAGEVLCSLLDETLAAFAVVFMREKLHGGPVAEAVLLFAFTTAQAISLAVLDRMLEPRRGHSPRAILAWSSLACAISYVGWLLSPSVAIAIALFALVGVFSAPLYPIAKAQAYRAAPEHSGLVNALSTLFLPFDMAAPLLVGFIADRAGIRFALLVLALQPIGLLVLALHPRAAIARRRAGQP
jgi:MFS family permease